MNLSQSDIELLIEKTKLPPERVYPLIETEEDLNLLLETIKPEELPKISTISFPVFNRIVVFNESKRQAASLSDKAFIAGCFDSFIDVQKAKKVYFSDNPRTDVQYAKYALILISIFSGIFRSSRCTLPSPNWYLSLAKNGFESAGREKLAETLEEWVLVLKRINGKYLYSSKIMDRVENRPDSFIIKEK